MKPSPPNRVKEVRETRGLDQGDLAERTGIAQSRVCRIEKGTAPLTTITMNLIAKACEADPWELLMEWSERHPSDHIRKLWAELDEANRAVLRSELINGVAAEIRGLAPEAIRHGTSHQGAVQHFHSIVLYGTPLTLSAELKTNPDGTYTITFHAGSKIP